MVPNIPMVDFPSPIPAWVERVLRDLEING